MAANNSDIITDLAVISERILFLETRVAELSDKVSSLEAESPAGIGGERDKAGNPAAFLEPPEGLGEWLGKGLLLQKMAVVCFILVFALLLRTVSDSGYINAAAGSWLGLAYVSILAGIGCFFYVNDRGMANVFSISGFLLLFTIVIEGHQRFGTIPTSSAYVILLIALATSAFVGIRYRQAGLLTVSVIGVAVAGMALDFPRLFFPWSGLLILLANGVAFIASERSVSGKLKWPVTLMTMLFMALWVFKVFAPLERGEPVPAHVYPDWLAPFLISLVGLYLAFYVGRYLKEAKGTVYDAVIPSLNLLLFFGGGGVIVRDYWQQPWLFGLFTLTLALGHIALGWRLLTRKPGSAVGMAGAFGAGALALTLAVPAVVGQVAWAIPIWALFAYGMARLSELGGSAFIRILSYLYPVFALLTGLAFDIYEVGQSISTPASLAAAASLALFGLMQYHWSRRNPPPARSVFVDLDGRDRSALLLLLVGLAGLYLLFSMIIDLAAPMLSAAPANIMKCGRSIIINIGAIVLLIISGRRRDHELAWIAGFLAIVGGLKVFLADLFTTGGIPLVFSVLSFGLVAMTGSAVLGRWNKGLADRQGTTRER